MKKLPSIMMGILFAGALAFAYNNSAIAAPGHPGKHHPGGHHGKHHGHHGGAGYFVSGSSYLVEDDCPTVKRCYINKFGEKRCRWGSECD
jgi:hypothetical protein